MKNVKVIHVRIDVLSTSGSQQTKSALTYDRVFLVNDGVEALLFTKRIKDLVDATNATLKS